MSRPDIRTNPQIIATITRSIVGWYTDHQAALSREIAEEEAIAETAAKLADALEEANSAYLREGREDKTVLTQRNAVIQEIQVFERSLRASVARRLHNRPENERKRIQSDFERGRISNVRTIKAAQQRLESLSTALKVHRASLSDVGQNRHDEWTQSIEGFKATLRDVAELLGREKQETAQALVQREETRANTINFILLLDLAAQAIAHTNPEVYSSLRLLFDTHNSSAS